jgi:hypothetical protein
VLDGVTLIPEPRHSVPRVIMSVSIVARFSPDDIENCLMSSRALQTTEKKDISVTLPY